MGIDMLKVTTNLTIAAVVYKEYFLNRSFIFVDEEYSCVEVYCEAKDFAHLTGVYTKLDDYNFYKRCEKGKIESTQIGFNDRFTYKSHKKKMEVFKKLNTLVDGTHNNSRGLYNVLRKKGNFPFAVADFDTTLCCSFKNKVLHPKSLRKEKIKDYSANKRIIFIAERNGFLGRYKKINFGSARIINKLPENIQMKFDPLLLTN